MHSRDPLTPPTARGEGGTKAMMTPTRKREDQERTGILSNSMPRDRDGKRSTQIGMV